MEPYVDTLLAALLVSLRLAPAFAFAPPFTYVAAPAIVRVLLCLGLSAWLAGSGSHDVSAITHNAGAFAAAVCTELMLGVALSLSLQIAFAALLTAGRTIDFQAGFGLSLLADPTLKTQMPLIGTLFAYAAGAVFFATSGPADFLALWQASLDRVPLGSFSTLVDLKPLLAYVSSAFGLALGLAGGVLLALFAADVAIALLSRTLPQMNVLMLGFQVKTITLLVSLPFVFALASSLFLRLIRLATSTSLGFF